MCQFKNGKYNTSKANDNGCYPLYTSRLDNPSHKINGYCFDDDEYLLFLKSGGNGKTPLSYSLGIGSVYYVQGKTGANTDVVQIKLYTNLCNLKYLYRYLNDVKLEIQKLANYGTNLGHVDMNKFKKFKIPVPPIKIQKKCIEIYEIKENKFKEYEEEIKKYEQKIEDLKTLAQNVIIKHITNSHDNNQNNTSTVCEENNAEENNNISELDDEKQIIKPHNKKSNSKINLAIKNSKVPIKNRNKIYLNLLKS